MGSTSAALFPNLKLIHGCCSYSKPLAASQRRHHRRLQLLSSPKVEERGDESRRGRLGFSVSRSSRRRFARFAVVDDGVGGKQEETSSSGAASAVEERPPVGITKATSDEETKGSAIYDFLYPDKELLPDDTEMSLFDHLEELRQRLFISVLAVGGAIAGCFAFSKELVIILEAPVKSQGVRFLQLAPGEFFFTTLKVSPD
ncbi:Sec-independent protein translocase protein TATC, chloroplastic [Linum grandiflorum]